MLQNHTLTRASLILLFVISSSVAAFTIDTNNDENGNLYLINQEGRTLYYFINDPTMRSTCFEGCSEIWPPFYADRIDIPSNLKREDFDYIPRADGVYQTTYKGRPLYLYSGDSLRGELTGEGLQGLWLAVRP
ncbi:MAG: hypothetical protein MUO26_15455 [Methanotrichaceae archaeon]|nr:hypothetical protein [Methanotrichaceae archaeon]